MHAHRSAIPLAVRHLYMATKTNKAPETPTVDSVSYNPLAGKMVRLFDDGPNSTKSENWPYREVNDVEVYTRVIEVVLTTAGAAPDGDPASVVVVRKDHPSDREQMAAAWRATWLRFLVNYGERRPPTSIWTKVAGKAGVYEALVNVHTIHYGFKSFCDYELPNEFGYDQIGFELAADPNGNEEDGVGPGMFIISAEEILLIGSLQTAGWHRHFTHSLAPVPVPVVKASKKKH